MDRVLKTFPHERDSVSVTVRADGRLDSLGTVRKRITSESVSCRPTQGSAVFCNVHCVN